MNTWPLLDQRSHLPVEEGQQQRPDVRAVDVGIGHDHDLAVAQLRDVELVLTDPGAQRGDDRADLLVAQHLVEARLLDVEDLAAQRQDRLETTISSLPSPSRPPNRPRPGRARTAPGRAPGSRPACPGSDPDSRAPLRRVSSRARCAASLARAASTPLRTIFLAGPGFCSRNAPSRSLTDRLDRPLDVGVAQLGLGLTFELGFGDLDRERLPVRPSRQSSPLID